MRKLTAFIAGLLFGFGLLLAGMANPKKVLGFLDLAGTWDPSLALVMIGAIGTAIAPWPGRANRLSRCWAAPCSCRSSENWTHA